MFEIINIQKTHIQHILLVIASMDAGGAERVTSILANAWVSSGRKITLLTLDNNPGSHYKLAPSVKRLCIGMMCNSRGIGEAIYYNIKRVLDLRKVIAREKPDTIISFIDQTNVLTLFATVGLKVPVIISERIDPALHKIGTIWNRLRRITYPWAGRIVVQTPQASAYFPASYKQFIDIVPNPVLTSEPCIQLSNTGSKVILGMGRLEMQKGFDLLVKAFAKIASNYSDWELVIYGEGSQRNQLQQLVTDLQLAQRIRFSGITEHPLDVMRSAGIFVLSSRYEGFPNVLLDAMACGLPVISFDCPSGPASIIQHDQNGILVPNGDINALSASMGQLLGDPGKRQMLASKAVHVRERFSLEKILQKWEEVLHSARILNIPRRPKIADIYFTTTERDIELMEQYERNFFNNIRQGNGVFMTTNSHRLDDINKCMLPFLPSARPLNVMDVAVSSGISSLEWSMFLNSAGVKHNMVAGDIAMNAFIYSIGNWLMVLTDQNKRPLQFDLFNLALPNVSGTRILNFFFKCCLKLWALFIPISEIISRKDWKIFSVHPLRLVSPQLLSSPIQFVQDDIQTNTITGYHEYFHVIRAANILNHCYFPEDCLYKAINNIRERLQPDGLLIICRSTDDGSNNGSIFRAIPEGGFELLSRIGQGSEVETFVLSKSLQ